MMNQEKIGRFIAACRKDLGLTQAALAEKLGITDRAVSKWETGKNLPDTALMLELCDLLQINVNELLTGERLVSEDYQKKAAGKTEQSEAAVFGDGNRLCIQCVILGAYFLGKFCSYADAVENSHDCRRGGDFCGRAVSFAEAGAGGGVL